MRRITLTKQRPLTWPDPDWEDTWEDTWEDEWGTHTLKKGVLTTERTDPRPVRMTLKRKYRGWK